MLRRPALASGLALAILIGCGLPGPVGAFETWVEQRDRGVVRQARDYSCGLAALATLLAGDGATEISENALLTRLLAHRGAGARGIIEDRGVSFADLATLAGDYGRRSLGLALAPDSLRALRRPAIVALDIDGRAHFTVLRSVAADGSALLADPSWGNRRLGAWEFTALFAGDDGIGRVLLIEAAPPGPESEDPGRAGGTGPQSGDRRAGKWPVRLAPGLLGPRAPG